MKKRPFLLPILVGVLLAFGFSTDVAAADKEFPQQAGTGSVDRFTTHGREVYRFVPTDKKLRMVKFVPGQLGYKKNKLPKEYEEILSTALKDQKQIFLDCKYFDHGPKKTAIGKKIIVLKLVESEPGTE